MTELAVNIRGRSQVVSSCHRSMSSSISHTAVVYALVSKTRMCSLIRITCVHMICILFFFVSPALSPVSCILYRLSKCLFKWRISFVYINEVWMCLLWGSILEADARQCWRLILKHLRGWWWGCEQEQRVAPFPNLWKGYGCTNWSHQWALSPRPSLALCLRLQPWSFPS